MKLNKSMAKLLSNKMVLNVVSIISLLTLIGYLTLGKMNEVFMFVLISVIIYSFNKNMILVLGIPLITVVTYNVLKGNNYVEGMEGNNTDNKEGNIRDKIINNKDNKNNTTDNINEKDNTNEKESNNNETTSKDNSNAPRRLITAANRKNQETTVTDETTTEKTTEESFALPSKKGAQYNIDYAATVEDAYSELSKILDGDGIKRLTDDTQRLMKQQMMLADSMKNMQPMIQGMAPLLKQAESLLGNMNNGKSNLGGLADLAKNLGLNFPVANK